MKHYVPIVDGDYYHTVGVLVFETVPPDADTLQWLIWNMPRSDWWDIDKIANKIKAAGHDVKPLPLNTACYI